MERDNKQKPTDHLANERTFLAWIRTGIAIMAFGFVVVKFALFVRQLGFILNQEDSSPVVPNHGYSASIGITLVGLGIIVTFLAFLQYKRTERQLNTDSFSSSSPLSILLTLAIILVGLLLMIYLVASV